MIGHGRAAAYTKQVKDQKRIAMRKEIYEKVSDVLRSLGCSSGGRLIRHVDLWNHNVEFLEQESAWERPAVFLEFGPITWQAVKDGEMRGQGTLRLHVVTDWVSDGLDASTGMPVAIGVGCWSLCDRIEMALRGLRGATFHELRLRESHTNHNHEEIVETIEVYDVRGVRHTEEAAALESAVTSAVDAPSVESSVTSAVEERKE